MHDDQFRTILNNFQLSWDGYRRVRKGVKKRINRHMQYCGCHTATAYMERLHQNKRIKDECEQLLTVSISRFFRDRPMWEFLETLILPELIKEGNNKIKVWAAGCACGEEAYSARIVWDRLTKTDADAPELDVTATDMNPAYLENAAAGIYTQSSLKEMTADEMCCYFEKEKGKRRYRINDRLKNHIFWHRLDHRQESLEEEFHIIFLRNNILTYYLDPLKTNTFNTVLNCLAPAGILIIGANEVLPDSANIFEAIPPFSYVFKKV